MTESNEQEATASGEPDIEESLHRAIGRIQGLDRALDIFTAATETVLNFPWPGEGASPGELVVAAKAQAARTIEAFHAVTAEVRADLANESRMLKAKLAHGLSTARH